MTASEDRRPRTPSRIPAARYTAPGWHDLERERMWNRVWQIACTEDCIPDPGDFWEYSIADLSIIIVRGEDRRIRAFQNVCPHRGNMLLCGHGSGLEEIKCAYHHWRYDLKGRLRGMSPQGDAARRSGSDASRVAAGGEARPADAKSGDAQGAAGRVGLVPVQVGTWGGFVFVNPDLSAESLEDYLESLPEELAWVGMESFSCDQFMTVPLDCNWKACVDAFIETYHLHAVHPQMLAIADDVGTPITLYDKHTMFMQPYGVSSPRRGEDVSAQEVWEAFVMNLGHRMGIPFADASRPGPHPEIPDGQTMRDVLVDRIRKHLATMGSLYQDLDDHHVIDDFHYHVFPNAVFNVFAGWFGLIRARPGPTPDSCFLDMWNFDLREAGSDQARPRPEEVVLGPEELAALGPVLNQDLDLLPRVQRGLHQPGLESFRLTPAESRIGRMHQILDRYLDPPDPWRLDPGDSD